MGTALNRLRSLKFGYVPYQPKGNSPGDRRRFPTIATRLELDWEFYQDGRDYDVIYVTSNGDLTKFHRLPQSSTKMAFEMVDSYMAVPQHHPKALIRGVGKWAFKKHSHLEFLYSQTLRRIAKRADLVVCSTPEQCKQFENDNPNRHDILDLHEELSTGEPGRLSADDGRLHVFWEGIGISATHFDVCSQALQSLAREIPLTLHFVTDFTYKPLNAPLPVFQTKKMLRRTLGDTDFQLVEWSQFSVKAIASHCDLGIIPLTLSDPLASNKPENKLLIMWRLGLPVVASATPAYSRVMSQYKGPNWCCSSLQEWGENLRQAAFQPEAREKARKAGLDYVRRTAGIESIQTRWIEALDSLNR